MTMKSPPLEVCAASEFMKHQILATMTKPAFDVSTTEMMTEVVK